MYTLYMVLFYFFNIVICQHDHVHSKTMYDKCEYKKVQFVLFIQKLFSIHLKLKKCKIDTSHLRMLNQTN